MEPLIAALALFAAAPRLARVDAPSVWPVVADGGTAWAGVIGRGATIELEGCEDGGRAFLAGGRAIAGCGVFGPTDAGTATPGEAPLRWASVGKQGATVLRLARADAGAVEHLAPPHTVALLDDPELFARGWAPRASGGFVQLSEVRLARPSPFAGEATPVLPLAFAWRDTHLAPAPPLLGPAAPVAKHARFRVERTDGSGVVTPGGTLPRDAIRLAVQRPRPAAVPREARWVHVDLTEQVLTAYEGDRPVYATLVSAGIGGRPERRTRTGLFRVWLKSRHDRMHGEDYFVEEVPFILFFSGGQGLHGTFWHSAFGRPASHGCVNLSLHDAEWLFEWAPPALPAGWHTVSPAVLGAETLWVQIERPPAAAVSGPALAMPSR